VPPTTASRSGSASTVTDETLRALHTELVRLGRRRDPGAAMTLDASAYKILWLVVEHGPHTLRGLAHYLQLDQSTINRQVHAVIGHGHVERYDDPDSSGMLVRATASGEAAYRHDAEIRSEGLRAIVNTLGERSAADLARGLARFNDAIDDAVEASLPQRD
jgi:DNA-binding MarR family transcriptional regulator